MPKISDLKPISMLQQDIYIIQESTDSIDDTNKSCMHYIETLINQLQCEAHCNPKVAFNICLTRYQDTYNWIKNDVVTLNPDEPFTFSVTPNIIFQEKPVWDIISEAVYHNVKDAQSKGLSSFIPIFIFLVNKSDSLDIAKNGYQALATNPYFIESISENRRLIFCTDSIWDDNCKTSLKGKPYDMDLIFPYRLFSSEVIDHFMQIPKRMYQSGGLDSELLSLHNPDFACNSQNAFADMNSTYTDNAFDGEW